MPLRTRTLYGIIALLLAFVLIFSGVAALYYYRYNQAEYANQTYVQQLKQLNVKYFSNILTDYGNGTKTWHNDTKVEPGWNLYVTTQVITSGHVNATYYPQYGSHFVTAIYNLANTKDRYWLLWTYNATASWQMAQAGPDQLPMYNGSVYAWTYCGADCAKP